MVRLKDKLRREPSPAGPQGFDFPRPSYRAFRDEDIFRTAVKEQADATVVLDAKHLGRVDISGTIDGYGESWRLTKDAFGQICHMSNLPVSYVTNLAKRNEALALECVAEALEGRFRVAPRQIVVNTDTGMVENVLEESDRESVPNSLLLDFIRSQEGQYEMSRAFLEGPNARMTFVNRLHVLEPKPGDVLHVGVDIQTRMGLRYPATFELYNERLVCTNGMLTRNALTRARVDIQDELDLETQAAKALLRVASGAVNLEPLTRAATEMSMSETHIERMVDRLSDPKRGGSKTLLQSVVPTANMERKRDGRDDGDFTLWDFVNGITDAAKTARSIHRESDLEGLGFSVMGEFLSMN